MKTPIKTIITALMAVLAGHAAHAQISLPANTNLLTSNDGALLVAIDAVVAASNGGTSLLLNSGVNEPGKFVTGWTTGTPVSPNPFGTAGGTVKVMFLGKTAGWQNDLGYVLYPPPGTHNALVTGIGVGTGALTFGDYTTINYGPGANPIDFFVNAVPTAGDSHGGGVYYAFGTAGEAPSSPAGINIVWQNFWVDGILTTVVGFEDFRPMDPDNDHDYNDLVLAFQIEATAVPEPATYGMIGAAALLGLAGYRRFKMKPKPAT